MKSSSAGELIRGLVWKPIRSAAVESSEQWRRVLTTGRLAAGDARDTSSSNEGSSFVDRVLERVTKRVERGEFDFTARDPELGNRAKADAPPGIDIDRVRKVLARAISQERAVERGKQPEEASSTEASDLEERLRKEVKDDDLAGLVRDGEDVKVVRSRLASMLQGRDSNVM